jgi:hypothetical protein
MRHRQRGKVFTLMKLPVMSSHGGHARPSSGAGSALNQRRSAPPQRSPLPRDFAPPVIHRSAPRASAEFVNQTERDLSKHQGFVHHCRRVHLAACSPRTVLRRI